MLTQQYENNSIYPWSFLGIFRRRSNKLFQCTNLHNTGWSIMISSFQIISRPSSNYQPWMTFEVRNWKYMENTLKIKVFGKSILFCKYLRNKSLDLHEIFFGGQLLSCELKNFMKIQAFVTEIFAKQYWLSKYFNFQCIFRIFIVSHLKSLSKWKIT